MNELSPPVARPVENAAVPVQVVPLARPVLPVGGSPYLVAKPPTEPFAVASAICGMTAIIPVFSQIMGLTLGVISMIRFRRAKRNGLHLSGKGWAIAGIVTSGFALVGWIGFAVALTSVGASLLGSTDALNALLVTPTP